MSGRTRRVLGVRRPVRRGGGLVFVLVVLLGVGSVGCGDDPPAADGGSVGPVGPVGPAGPVGPVGPVGSSAIDDGVLVGSGELVKESRVVDEFDRVVLAGEGEVTIVVGGEASVEVETDANLVEAIETSVRAGVLEIRTQDGVEIVPSDSVRYRIAVPRLGSIAISGAGSFEIGRWSTETPRIELSGVGDIAIGRLESEALVVEHLGVGSIVIAGTVTDQRIELTGAGGYDASDLQSVTASVDASGTSTATLWVTGTLDVTVSDTSTVSYFGSPELTQQTEDLATVTSLGERSG